MYCSYYSPIRNTCSSSSSSSSNSSSSILRLAYYFSTGTCELSTLWKNLLQHLCRRKRLVHYIAGDGFCFLKSVLFCLLKDHQIEMECKEFIQIITEQLIDHHGQYVAFHNTVIHIDPNIYNSDLLLTEAMDFFEDREFIRDDFDLLVQVTADALGLEIFIYQKHNEKIKIIKYSGGTCCKPVCLKFTHNAKQSQGNHYDSIIKEKNQGGGHLY